jgi:hypothetical protein
MLHSVTNYALTIGHNLVTSFALDVAAENVSLRSVLNSVEILTQRNPHRKHPSPTRGRKDPAS